MPNGQDGDAQGTEDNGQSAPILSAAFLGATEAVVRALREDRESEGTVRSRVGALNWTLAEVDSHFPQVNGYQNFLRALNAELSLLGDSCPAHPGQGVIAVSRS